MIEWYILACTHSLAHSHTHTLASIEIQLYWKAYTTVKSTNRRRKKIIENWRYIFIQIRTLFDLGCGTQASDFPAFARNYYAFVRLFRFQILLCVWFNFLFNFFFQISVHISHSRTTLKKSRCFFFFLFFFLSDDIHLFRFLCSLHWCFTRINVLVHAKIYH